MKSRERSLKYVIFLFLAVFALIGCSDGHHDHKTSDEKKSEPVRVTAWSAKSELFMEYDWPKAGEKAGFLIHLTRLSDFKPVTEGGLKLIFTPASGVSSSFTIAAPVSPGIYKTEIVLTAPGNYTLKLITDGKGFEDEIPVSDVKVLSKEETPADGQSAATGAIAYLKEQQWGVDFKVEQPVKRNLKSFFNAMGELVPRADAEVTVSVPLAGIVSTVIALPFTGKKVAKGDILAMIDPPVRPDGGIGQLSAAYAEAKNRNVLARKEYDRAKRLYEANIAPLKRVEEAEAALESSRAALEPLEKAMEGIKVEQGGRFALRAPIAGTVAEVSTGAGKGVEAGQPVLRIVNTATLWLKVHVPATQVGAIHKAVSATFSVAGHPGKFTPVKRVSIGDMLDPQTRTLPVLFEVANPSGLLKAGQFADVAIRTGAVDGALAVPREALVEDEGRWFVFIQSSGEAFDRREVIIGVEDEDYVQVTRGLMGDERVVTRGAYYVKQAESTGKGGADQGHAH
ncbi:MAG: hypothetical protein C0394_06965 [Syntrophus sp. (in: bacteria)]|nr:hypothetical protein [Syntrophus sp. (in: bacteria)]